MSLHETLQSQCDQGTLWQLKPYFDGDPIIRELFLAEDVRNYLGLGDIDYGYVTAERARLAVEDLLRFVNGGFIRCASEPFDKPAQCYLSPLHPKERGVWAIRNRENPQLRIFGLFADFDIFVVTSIITREELDQAKMWDTMRDEAVMIFQEILPGFLPKYGGIASDVCSRIILD